MRRKYFVCKTGLSDNIRKCIAFEHNYNCENGTIPKKIYRIRTFEILMFSLSFFKNMQFIVIRPANFWLFISLRTA